MTSVANGSLKDLGADRAGLVRELAQEARELVAGLPSGVQRVEVIAGDCAIAVEWTAPAVPAPASPVTAAPAPPAEVPSLAAATGDRHLVRAPLVGAFYRRPGPDKAAYVEVGDVVAAGQTLCIVEAMKLMNEIKADRPGTVTAVYPADGAMVEFDEVLVELAPVEGD
ncbi:biotin/lipoyl-containing protein [Actinomycetes bacterium KLBMP 9797]